MAVDAIARDLRRDAGASGAAPARDRLYLADTRGLADAVRRSNLFIDDRTRQEPDKAGMGTTLVGSWTPQHVASAAPVGDGRAYLWRGPAGAAHARPLRLGLWSLGH